MADLPTFPRMSRGGRGIRPERLLLLCFFDHRGISTVPQNISFLQHGSKFDIDIFNFWGCSFPFRLPATYELTKYAGVVLHNSLAYNVDSLLQIDANLEIGFRQYNGIKIIFRQDENYKARAQAKFIGENEFDVIFTCLSEGERGKVYPKEIVGDVEFIQMLTGYVTPDLRNDVVGKFGGARPIDVGYRGSLQPLSFGRLCYEKRTIGDDFLEHAKNGRLKCDISSRWEDRFSGDDWLRFLCRSKAVLGVESGASIFDLDGRVEKAIKEFKANSPGSELDRNYAEAMLEMLRPFEGNVFYNQISPRHFEAAATKTLQILFEGEYSGILIPWRHYVPLKRDFSNFAEVEGIVLDDEKRRTFVDVAFNEIIEAPNYHIERFVEDFDRIVESQLSKKGWIESSLRIPALNYDRTNVLLLCSHEPRLDPRIAWIQKQAPEGLVVHVLATRQGAMSDVAVEGNSNSGYTITVPCTPADHRAWQSFSSAAGGDASGIEDVLYLEWVQSLSPAEKEAFLGLASELPDDRTSWLTRYYLNTAFALVEYGLRISGISAIISCDLDTLTAAAVLKSRLNVPIMYDAHEFWPDSVDSFVASEFEFWQAYERRLLRHVDAAVTVSTGIADYMAACYGREFGVIPNCEPISALQAADRSHISVERFALGENGDDVCFLVQGVFAAGRGYELLIDAWRSVCHGAKLYLRGPYGAERDRLIDYAKNLGVFNNGVCFPEPVAESELVLAASFAAVGIIPYEPKSINNRHCGPNKLSQYMAAGLPILTNKLPFVASVVEGGDCGVVADFGNVMELVAKVNELAASPSLRARLGANAREHFRTSYNWNVVSVPFYETVRALVTRQGAPSARPSEDIVLSALRPSTSKPQPASMALFQSSGTPVPQVLVDAPAEAVPVSTAFSGTEIGAEILHGPSSQERPISRSVRYRAARLAWRAIPQRARITMRAAFRRVLLRALHITE